MRVHTHTHSGLRWRFARACVCFVYNACHGCDASILAGDRCHMAVSHGFGDCAVSVCAFNAWYGMALNRIWCTHRGQCAGGNFDAMLQSSDRVPKAFPPINGVSNSTVSRALRGLRSNSNLVLHRDAHRHSGHVANFRLCCVHGTCTPNTFTISPPPRTHTQTQTHALQTARTVTKRPVNS